MDLQKFRLLTTIIAVCIASGVFGQSTIRGFVKDKASGEGVLYANCYLEGTTIGVSTDKDGYFSMTKIPEGTYTLVISNFDYKTYKETFDLTTKRTITKNYLVEKGTVEIDGVDIIAEDGEQETQIRMSVESISPKDIDRVPSFGGQPDLVQVLTVLPGFISTGDQGGQLYIRGGSPVMNKVLLDGMIIYNAFHSIGLFSVFDSDIISNADVYTGGFNAEFGGRVSSIMDVSTRDGNKSKLSGRLGVSPFGARLLLEGPLKKLTENGSGISYILSAKTSYLEQSSKIFYDYINDEGLPFNFTDLYGKVSFGGSNGSKFNVFGFDFRDDVKYQSLSNLNWTNSGGGANFLVVPVGSPVLISGNFASSKYRITLKEEGLPDRFSGINGFNFGLNFKYILGENEVKYGIETVGFRTDFETFNALGVKVQQAENTSEIGAYVTYKFSWNKILFEPSFRAQYYGSLARFQPEPRVGIKYKVNERFRLKGAAGLYSQNLISANSDRDIVNLFYGFLAGPENLQDEFVTSDGDIREVKSSLQLASHGIFGFEFDITEKINLNVEGYVKNFRQLTNTNRNKLFPDNANTQNRPEVLRKDFIIESGIAKGIDLILKWEDRYTYIWVVYSLGNVDRWDGFDWYDPVFDRRHNINLVASQSFGKTKTWEVSSRWNLGSGLPFTQTQGYYQPANVEDGVGSNILSDNPADLGIFYAGLNEGRLPFYHRLDINIRKSLELKSVDFVFNAGVTNVYSRKNVFYVNRITGDRVDQLPFMPSLGIDIKF
jgi:hypothetical protein